MSMYLLTWNPEKWPWKEMEEEIIKIKTDGSVTTWWNCRSKKPQSSDLFFIMMVGTKKNGIFCSGIVDTLEKNVFSEFSKKITNILYGKINVLLDPNTDNILGVKELNEKFPQQKRWEPQQSGIEINETIQDEFESYWINFLRTKKEFKNLKKEHIEGSIQKKLFTYRERNGEARDKCIEHYGYTCQICKKSMAEIYGDIGKDYIHVHHIDFLSNTSEKHKVDPIKDLIPVCPNCHSMLHVKKNGKYLSVNELGRILNNK